MRDVNDGRVALSGVGTLAGTHGEIGEQLRHSGAERAIALTFAHESERTVRAIADAMARSAPECRSCSPISPGVPARVPTPDSATRPSLTSRITAPEEVMDISIIMRSSFSPCRVWRRGALASGMLARRGPGWSAGKRPPRQIGVAARCFAVAAADALRCDLEPASGARQTARAIRGHRACKAFTRGPGLLKSSSLASQSLPAL
jgi:hypothetical protein